MPVGETSTVDVHQIWGGISGARVGRIDVSPGRRLIWKEGDRRKIEAEIHQMHEWNRLVPGLVPAVEGQAGDEDRESFVGRFLDGVLLSALSGAESPAGVTIRTRLSQPCIERLPRRTALELSDERLALLNEAFATDAAAIRVGAAAEASPCRYAVNRRFRCRQSRSGSWT